MTLGDSLGILLRIFKFSSHLYISVSFSNDCNGGNGLPCLDTWVAVTLWPNPGLRTSDGDFLCAFVHILPACFCYFCFESIFSPEAPFDRIPLYKAHPVAVSPQPSPPAPSESDPSKASASTSSTSYAPRGYDDPPGSSESVGIMQSGFLSLVTA